MNAGGLIRFFFVAVALVWAFWLIFKKDMFSMSLGKLIMYFLGVVLTLLIVAWIVILFLPWWTVDLVNRVDNSANVQALEQIGQELWNDTVGGVGAPVVSEPGNTNPPATSPTASPVATPQGNTGAGQSLRGETVYTVKSGDTLYSLGRQFGVSVDAIRQRNNLTSDNIRVGQQLVIPAP